jgi:hypothetical protein
MSGTTESYTYNQPMTGQKWGTIERGSDHAFIPCDPANSDFQKYLSWCHTNTPPAGAPTPADFP